MTQEREVHILTRLDTICALLRKERVAQELRLLIEMECRAIGEALYTERRYRRFFPEETR